MLLITWVGLIAAPTGPADDKSDASRDSRRLITPATEASINAGLVWLAAHQDEDGAFGQEEDGAFGSVTKYRHNPGVAGLCGLALLASGSTPGRGPFGDAISRTVDYVLSCARPSGYLVEADWSYYHGPMYGHGFATMFLAEVYGMSPRDEVRDVLKRAVELIVDTQNEQGGWRYTPETHDADISVTVCQAMALRAARNAGISVPKETIDRLVQYIERSQNPDGGFRYRLLEAPESKFPRSAAALVALYTSGVNEGPVIERGLDYVMQYVPGGRGSRNQEYYAYGQYYAVQATWHAGGKYWDVWYPAARDELVQLQLTEGNWSDPWIGNEYATAMALIVLQLPNNLLPIFER
jgi:hypothetical protein